MAINPAQKDFTVQRRADFPLTLTVAAQVYNEDRSTKFADWTVAYTNRTSGIIDIKLTDTQTATFTPNELKYDVLLTEPSGDKNYYLEGTLYISEGYTA